MKDDPILLHIETSTDVCSVAISRGLNLIGHVLEREGRRHAAFLPLMIESARLKAGLSLEALDAVSYSKGPGSYTGLRVGLSTAKGICFALGKPLIGISTLLAMSYGSGAEWPGSILIPMIDARRDEVYREVYNPDRAVIEPAAPLILTRESFREYLDQGEHVLLCGNGALKARSILRPSELLHFGGFEIDAAYLVPPAVNCFLKGQFENLAYAVPEYLKAPAYQKAL